MVVVRTGRRREEGSKTYPGRDPSHPLHQAIERHYATAGSLSALSLKAGLSRSMASQILSGKVAPGSVSLPTLQALAGALGVPVSSLVRSTDATVDLPELAKAVAAMSKDYTEPQLRTLVDGLVAIGVAPAGLTRGDWVDLLELVDRSRRRAQSTEA